MHKFDTYFTQCNQNDFTLSKILVITFLLSIFLTSGSRDGNSNFLIKYGNKRKIFDVNYNVFHSY